MKVGDGGARHSKKIDIARRICMHSLNFCIDAHVRVCACAWYLSACAWLLLHAPLAAAAPESMINDRGFVQFVIFQKFRGSYT